MGAEIISGMPEKQYHALNALGSSPLKRFHDCPASVLDPVEVSEDMELGSAQDSFTLYGPEHFHQNFIIMPDFGDMRSPARRKERDEFIESMQGKGKTILPATVTTKKIPTLKAITDVDNFLYREHPMTKIIFRQGDQQLSLFWNDPDTGLACKGRLDHYPDPSYKTIFDLKKCARLDNFHNQIEKLRYFLQGGHYTNGALINGMDVLGFAFVAFNFGDPPEVRIVAMDDEYMEKSMRLARTTIFLIHECRQADHFPKYKVPLDTISMAQMLGLKSCGSFKQLAPQDMIEVAQTPYSLRAA